MKKANVIRAWKDKEYRASLSQEALAALPSHPAGFPEMSDDELNGVAGGLGGLSFSTTSCPYCRQK